MRCRLNKTLFLAFLILASTFSPFLFPATAQEPTPSPTPQGPSVDKVALHQALLDLSNSFVIMCVAAHPDDEDGTTLTVLRRKLGAKTLSLFSTFGEGGQNAVGPELYEELGVIRAHETLAASRIQGSEPHFLGLKDFGFSKSDEETFKLWGREEALRRMVLKIRELRPDVVITNHDTSRGHGHHQATGQLIIDAFDAAADPQRFPEQLAKLKPWQIKRLFVRMFRQPEAQGSSAPSAKIVSIDPNEVDPVRGVSFAEQALTALQKHATQGPWPKTIEDLLRARRVEAGKLPPIRYQLVREAAGVSALAAEATTFFDGLLPSAPPPQITLDGRPLIELLDEPGTVLDLLLEWRRSNPAVSSKPEHKPLEERLNTAITTAAGVSLVVGATDRVLIPGEKARYQITLTNNGDRSVEINHAFLSAMGQGLPAKNAEQLLPGTETDIEIERLVPGTAGFTVPKASHLYDGLVFGSPIDAVLELEIERVKVPLASRSVVDIVPAVEIKELSPSPYLWTSNTINQPLSLRATIANNRPTAFRGILFLSSFKFGTHEVGSEISLAPNETRSLEVKSNVIPIRARRQRGDFGVVSLEVRPKAAVSPVTQKSVRIGFVDARIDPKLSVGYVRSFDQTLEQSLATLGVTAKELTVADIKNADLEVYDTIIVDIRGYEAHPDLIDNNQRLLDFAKAGGTVIVFYHKSNEWNPDPAKQRPQLAPYQIILGEERVTDETASIKFLDRRHALLNFPNRITQADFNGWIQERGLYYPKEWDNRYAALFVTNDPGEKPLRSGLLATEHGQGHYIYSSMVWYRQLRAGVPGAYRVFANMISYGNRNPRTTASKRASTAQ